MNPSSLWLLTLARDRRSGASGRRRRPGDSVADAGRGRPRCRRRDRGEHSLARRSDASQPRDRGMSRPAAGVASPPTEAPAARGGPTAVRPAAGCPGGWLALALDPMYPEGYYPLVAL